MSYCPKCGNKVDETMVFCPRCGTSLKGTTSLDQATPTQPYQYEKAEKNQYSYVGYLIGGLILITIGVFAVLDLTNPINSSEDLAAMLLIIGVIIIVGAIYIATKSAKTISFISSSSE